MTTALDLGVHFGDQVRLKCPGCQRFVADLLGPTVTCSSCGAVYERRDGTKFVRAGT